MPETLRASLWLSRTGVDVGDDGGKAARQHAERLRGDARVGRALLAAGIDCQRKRSMTKMGPVSGITEAMPVWENRKIFPSMQRQQTSEMIKLLEAYIELHNIYVQMLVVSFGWVKLTELRSAQKRFKRELNELAAEVRGEWKGDIFYRNIEFPEHEVQGEVYVHLHAHLLIDLRRLSKEKYEAFKAFCRERTSKGYVHMSPLEKVSEACKYAFKSVVEFDDASIVELYHQTFRVNFYQPLGGFAVWKKQFEEHEVVDAYGEVHQVPARKVEKFVENGETVWRAIARSGELPPPPRDVDPDRPEPVNVCVGLQAASPWSGSTMEPAMLILNHAPDPADPDPVATVCRGNYALSRWVNQIRGIWNARKPLSAWVPMVSPADPSVELVSQLGEYAGRIDCRVVERDGRRYLVSKQAEDWDRRNRQAQAAQPRHGAHNHVSSRRAMRWRKAVSAPSTPLVGLAAAPP